MKLTRIKLNQLSKDELNEREMDSLLGGYCYQCACGCTVASTNTNMNANAAYGYTTTAGWGEDDNDKCACASDYNPESCRVGATAKGKPMP